MEEKKHRDTERDCSDSLSEKKHRETAETSGAKTKRPQEATVPSEGETHTLRCRNMAD